MTTEAIAQITRSSASIVEKLVVPKIESFCKKISRNYKTIMIPRAEHFQEYFVRAYKKYNSANLLAIKNSQRTLQDIYVPLTLQNNNHEVSDSQLAFKIDGYPKEMMDEFKRILIVDSAGMGKSTLSKIMFLNIIDTDRSAIPIFIELRRLSKSKSIIAEIFEQLNSLNKNFDESLMLDFISLGNFIFFLDGLDEISIESKPIVLSDIQTFISKAHNNYFILTSRDEDSLTSFGDFVKFSIAPLKKKEAFELLRKYDGQGSISKLLIDKLKLPENKQIEDFLTNPLLVSMLFSAFDYKQIIPFKIHHFYRQVYDALYNAHDLSKGDGYIHEKKSGLSYDDFERVLRLMGFICTKKDKSELSKEEILQMIGSCLDLLPGLSFNPSDYLDDLISTVPLFIKDGQYYRWDHKSLMEYFAAAYLFFDLNEKKGEALTKIYNSEHLQRYFNVLKIYSDIDTQGFNKYIALPVLTEYYDYIHNTSANRIAIKSLLFGIDRCELFVTNDPKIADNAIDRYFGTDKNEVICCSSLITTVLAKGVYAFVAEFGSKNYAHKLLLRLLFKKEIKPIKEFECDYDALQKEMIFDKIDILTQESINTISDTINNVYCRILYMPLSYMPIYKEDIDAICDKMENIKKEIAVYTSTSMLQDI